VFDMSVVNQAYVYISARTSDNAYVLGDANDYYEYKVALPTSILDGNNNPRVTISEVTAPTSTTSGIVVNNGTLFSGFTNVEKYYTISFVTATDNGSASVSPELLTYANVTAFVSTYLEGNSTITIGYTDLDSIANVVYYSDTTVPRYKVESITANVTLNGAFNTLTPTSPSDFSGDIVSVTDTSEWTFTTVIVAVDTAMRYGLGVFTPLDAIPKDNLGDYFAIPIDAGLTTLMNANNQWTVVYEVNPTTVPSNNIFDVMSINETNIAYVGNETSTHNYNINGLGSAFMWSPAARSFTTTYTSTSVPVDQWSRFGGTRGSRQMLFHTEEVRTLTNPFNNGFTAAFGGVETGKYISIGSGKVALQAGHWTGSIRNIALFNTDLDLSLLPTDLRTLNQTSHPSLVAFFDGSSNTSTIGYSITGEMLPT
jgi:hypothetical protein